MNFFEQQDLARRKTQRLILLLLLAVISLIAITVLMLAGVLTYFQTGSESQLIADSSTHLSDTFIDTIDWSLIVWTSAIISLVVAGGSLYKFLQLRGGGQTIAEAMGGRLLSRDTDDIDEQKILNVVEEMAIASGSSIPPVYLLDDDAINAFAAGHTPQNAVIGITRGCIQLLTRDELQGVVAHEFSHIFHGDMRLNIRLVAVLHGILLLGLIGGYLLRTTHHRSMLRSNRDKSPGAILAIGLGLMVIGYAGTFFGNLIKAAVSRQREFLADASAVKFTRNPDGIAGALKKIGGYSKGSELDAQHAAEFSHMYFSQGVSPMFNSLMATHPPLGERIQRIEPGWGGSFSLINEATTHTAEQQNLSDREAQVISSLNSGAGVVGLISAAEIQSTINQIGQASSTHLAYAREQISAIGDDLRNAARDPLLARGLIFGLLLDKNIDVRQAQWQQLLNTLPNSNLAPLRELAEQAAQLNISLRIPLTELTLPSLKELAPSDYDAFKRGMKVLINADQKVSLMEWALERIVLHYLEPAPKALRLCDLRERRSECQLLLSVLAYAGADRETDAHAAFTAAIAPLRFASLQILAKSECKLVLLDAALISLNQLKPLQKPVLLKAMGKCITHDGKITITEAELLRAMADGLNCPMPPLVV